MQRTFILVLLLLTGCQSAAWRNDPGSPFYRVPAGAKLVLHRDIAVPAQRTGVYLQAGRIVGYGDINTYHPYCALDLRRRADTAQTIAADTFVVVRSTQETVLSVRTPAPWMTAGSLQLADGDYGHQIYATILDLRSSHQPEMLNLTCAHWVYPPMLRHLTLDELRQALGEIGTLSLN